MLLKRSQIALFTFLIFLSASLSLLNIQKIKKKFAFFTAIGDQSHETQSIGFAIRCNGKPRVDSMHNVLPLIAKCFFFFSLMVLKAKSIFTLKCNDCQASSNYEIYFTRI